MKALVMIDKSELSSGFCTQSEGDRQICLFVSCDTGLSITTPANFLEVYSMDYYLGPAEYGEYQRYALMQEPMLIRSTLCLLYTSDAADEL